MQLLSVLAGLILLNHNFDVIAPAMAGIFCYTMRTPI